MEYKFQLDSISKIKSRLGVEKRGKVQKFVDTTIAKGMDKYVPFREGALKSSVMTSSFGSGILVYDTPYAKRRFYEGKEPTETGRGKLWAERYTKREMNNLIIRVQKYVDGN